MSTLNWTIDENTGKLLRGESIKGGIPMTSIDLTVVDLQETHRLRAICDSGATRTSISTPLLHQFFGKKVSKFIKNTDYKSIAATGAKLNIKGELPVTMRCLGKLIAMDIIVYECSAKLLLFGFDAIRQGFFIDKEGMKRMDRTQFGKAFSSSESARLVPGYTVMWQRPSS